MEQIVEISDKIHKLNAMLLTCSYAIGNRELFSNGPQSIAVVLDYIGGELETCCRSLEKMTRMQSEDSLP